MKMQTNAWTLSDDDGRLRMVIDVPAPSDRARTFAVILWHLSEAFRQIIQSMDKKQAEA